MSILYYIFSSHVAHLQYAIPYQKHVYGDRNKPIDFPERLIILLNVGTKVWLSP